MSVVTESVANIIKAGLVDQLDFRKYCKYRSMCFDRLAGRPKVSQISTKSVQSINRVAESDVNIDQSASMDGRCDLRCRKYRPNRVGRSMGWPKVLCISARMVWSSDKVTESAAYSSDFGHMSNPPGHLNVLCSTFGRPTRGSSQLLPVLPAGGEQGNDGVPV